MIVNLGQLNNHKRPKNKYTIYLNTSNKYKNLQLTCIPQIHNHLRTLMSNDESTMDKSPISFSDDTRACYPKIELDDYVPEICSSTVKLEQNTICPDFLIFYLSELASYWLSLKVVDFFVFFGIVLIDRRG